MFAWYSARSYSPLKNLHSSDGELVYWKTVSLYHMKSSPPPPALAEHWDLDGAGRSSGAVVVSASSSESDIDHRMVLLTNVNHNFDFLSLMRVSDL